MPLNKEIDNIINIALREDIGRGDVTTRFSIPAGVRGKVVMIARENGVICGVDIFRDVMRKVDKNLKVTIIKKDGSLIKKDDLVISITGNLAAILTAERVALNFLAMLSGVATTTYNYVRKVKGTKAKILDTRKTTPGMRLIEKYAVRMGRGVNHRIGLYDGIIIKDNHLRAAGILKGKAVDSERLRCVMAAMRKNLRMPVEIEVESLAEFKAVAKYGPDVVMLDNFNVPNIRKAVKVRDKYFPGIKLEASGGINFKNVRAVAKTGVDLISIGSITHSPKSFDFSLEISRVD